jgi:acyl carrier protein
MPRPEPAQKLETIFSDLMPGEPLAPRQRTKTNCAAWDSLFQINLILSIEQEFGISITDEEAIDLNSFETALDIVQSKLPGEAPHHG